MYAMNPVVPQQQLPVGAVDNKSSLWMGELEPWMDENFIRQIFFTYGENVHVKMIRDKFTGQIAGYCFVEFSSPVAANKVLATLNGTVIPGTNRAFKLNWASGGGVNDRKEDRPNEHSIFVGDLGSDVNDYILLATFSSRYPSAKSAEVKIDPATGQSRGYGFVRFTDESEVHRAIAEMNGQYCGSRQMRINIATPKNKLNPQMNAMNSYGQQQALIANNDPNNTTVFVGGITGPIREDDLRNIFQQFGDITYVKIPQGKGCGFVTFGSRLAAEQAIASLDGAQIGTSRMRLSWGRSNQDKNRAMMMPYGMMADPNAAAAAAAAAAYY